MLEKVDVCVGSDDPPAIYKEEKDTRVAASAAALVFT